MSRIRIVCRKPYGPERPPTERPFLNGLAPSLHECEVYALGDDGTQVPLTNVTQIIWYVNPGEPARAQLRFMDVDIDAEAVDELAFERPSK